ncbi:MAG: CapA family protein [Lachnospiraceae bacterium]|nr:CapA family protein [Lachnospiraceae bacterium]
MAYSHRQDNLDEQLRRDRRIETRAKLKKRLEWMIPLGFFSALLIIGLIYLFQKLGSNKSDDQKIDYASLSPVTVLFAGDISPSPEAVESYQIGRGYDFSACFHSVMAQTLSADLAVANLEGNISDSADKANYPPALLNSLSSIGFDILQTGNSYSIQNGITGLKRTRSEIENAGMQSVGTCISKEEYDQTGGIIIKEVNGIRFAFLAFTKGMVDNMHIPEEAAWCVNLLYSDDVTYSKIASDSIANTVKRAKAMNPDVIVALVHWGSEYNDEITESQRKIADLLCKNGASLIIGTHSHYVGPIVQMKNESSPTGSTLIAYGLGDFVSSADTEVARSGCILNVQFKRTEERVILSNVQYTPVYSTEPSEALECNSWEVLDCLQAVKFYEENYYDRVSEPIYDLLLKVISHMKDQTGAAEWQK